MNSTKLLVALFISSVFTLKAQQPQITNEHNHEHIDNFYLPLDFDKDSLRGFNEEAAWQQAKMSTDQAWRQERIVAVLKEILLILSMVFQKQLHYLKFKDLVLIQILKQVP
jgi:hypothetical protein